MLTVLIGCTLEEPSLCTRHARIQNSFSGGLIGCTLEELSLCTRHARIQNIFSGGVQIPRRGSDEKFQHGKFNNLAIPGGGGSGPPVPPPLWIRPCKVSKNECPPFINELFHERIPNENLPTLRSLSEHSFVTPRPHKEIFKQSLAYSGPPTT